MTRETPRQDPASYMAIPQTEAERGTAGRVVTGRVA